MKLRYFGNETPGTWRKEQVSEPLRCREWKDKELHDDYCGTETEAAFVFETTAGRTIRVDRPFLPIREDPPVELKGCINGKNGERMNGPDLNPTGDYAVAVYANKSEEVVFVCETATLEKPGDMLTIRKAAAYVERDERTIRSWLKHNDSNGKPMLPNTIKQRRMIRIQRSDLAPWKKTSPQENKPQATPKKRTKRKAGKRKR